MRKAYFSTVLLRHPSPREGALNTGSALYYSNIYVRYLAENPDLKDTLQKIPATIFDF